MTRKQSQYLADLLSDEEVIPSPDESTSLTKKERNQGTTLLGRESALARVASGEVRQITQLLLDPKRVRIWPGNARHYSLLTEANCRDLIDSIIAEGGQKVAAVVRRVDDDAAYDYEVIAGTRRHWSISWLRNNSYPQFMFVAQVDQLGDEAAFRLADIENRARADVTDLERARNYSDALATYYGGHQTRMAERLKLSKGWLSKMLRIAAIPDDIIAAFGSLGDVQLKQGYSLAQALDNKDAAQAIYGEAKLLANTQQERISRGSPTLPPAEVFRRLLDAPNAGSKQAVAYTVSSTLGRQLLTVQSANRQGVTIRFHAGSGADEAEIVESVRILLNKLEQDGKGLQR